MAGGDVRNLAQKQRWYVLYAALVASLVGGTTWLRQHDQTGALAQTIAAPTARVSVAQLSPQGGVVSSLAISSVDPPFIMAGLTSGGIAVRQPTGQVWHMLMAPPLRSGQVAALIPDPLQGNVIYIILHPNPTAHLPTTLYKSTNRGLSWLPFGSGLPDPSVTAFAIDPSTPSTLYAGTSSGLYRSVDAGAQWTAISTGIAGTSINQIVIDPANRYRIWVATGSGVYVSLNDGLTWRAPLPAQEYYVNYLIERPDLHNVLYAATFSGIYMSEDSGITWIDISNGLTSLASNVFALAIAPHSAHTIVAATADGVYLSTDSGAHWQSAGLSGHPITTLALSWQDHALLAGSPVGGGVLVSTDSGAHWHSSVAGMQGVLINQMAVIPNSQIVMAASTTAGLYRSLNGGMTWSANGPSMPPTATLLIDNTGFLPIPPIDALALAAGPAAGAVYALLSDGQANALSAAASADSATSWLTSTLTSTQFSAHLVTDANLPGHLLAGGSELAYSANGGASWFVGLAPLNPTDQISAIAADPMLSGHALAAVQDTAGDLVTMLTTLDGGIHWQTTNVGLPVSTPGSQISTIVFDASHAGSVFAAGRAVYRSHDSGMTWTELSLPSTLTSALDSGAAQLVSTIKGLFLAIPGMVWASWDDARTWSVIATLPGGDPIAAMTALSPISLVVSAGTSIYRVDITLPIIASPTPTPTPMPTVGPQSLSDGVDISQVWYIDPISAPIPRTIAILNPTSRTRHAILTGTSHRVFSLAARSVTRLSLPGNGTLSTTVGIQGAGPFILTPTGDDCVADSARAATMWTTILNQPSTQHVTMSNPSAVTATVSLRLVSSLATTTIAALILQPHASALVSPPAALTQRPLAIIARTTGDPAAAVLLSTSTAVPGNRSRFGVSTASPDWWFALTQRTTQPVNTLNLLNQAATSTVVTLTLFDGQSPVPQELQVTLPPISLDTLRLGLASGNVALHVSAALPIVAAVDGQTGVTQLTHDWVGARLAGSATGQLELSVFNPTTTTQAAQLTPLIALSQPRSISVPPLHRVYIVIPSSELAFRIKSARSLLVAIVQQQFLAGQSATASCRTRLIAVGRRTASG